MSVSSWLTNFQLCFSIKQSLEMQFLVFVNPLFVEYFVRSGNLSVHCYLYIYKFIITEFIQINLISIMTKKVGLYEMG